MIFIINMLYIIIKIHLLKTTVYKLNNTIKPQDNANIDRLKSIIDTRIKMLEIVEENNSYKKKVIFTLISLIFLALIAMITIFINFSKFFKK